MSEIRVSCPGCQVAMKLPDSLAGKKVRCPRCRTSFVVPAAAPPQKPATQLVRKARPPVREEERVAPPEAPPKVRRAAEEDRPAARTRRPREDEDEPPAKKPVRKRGVFAVLVTLATVLMLLGYGAALAVVYLDYFEVPVPGIDDKATYKAKAAERARLAKPDQHKDRADKDKGQPKGEGLPLVRNDAEAQKQAADRGKKLESAQANEKKLVEQLARASNHETTGLAVAILGTKEFTGFGQTAFSPNGQILAEIRDRKAILWDLGTGKRGPEFSDAKQPISAITFSANSKNFLAATAGKKVVTWDVKSGKQTSATVQFTDPAPIFQPGGQKLAALSDAKDMAPKVWGLSGKDKTERRLEGQFQGITAKAFRPDGKVLALAWRPQGGTALVGFFEVATGKPYSRTFEGSVDRMAFSPDGWLLATTHKGDKELRLCDLASGQERRLAHGESVTSFVFTPDGKHLLTSDGKDLRVWDVASGTVRARHEMELSSLNVSPGGVLLIGHTREVWLLSELLDEKLSENVAEARKLGEVKRNGLAFQIALAPNSKVEALTQLKRLLLTTSISLKDVGEVGDAWLAEVKSLTALRRLSLEGAKGVTNAGLANLEELKDLESLDLSSAGQVGDEGMSHLQKLTNLKVLRLSRTQLSDKGLAPLHKLSKLERLHVEDTQVSDDGIAELKKALPGVNVVK